MELDSDEESYLQESDPLKWIVPEILASLKHLDLTRQVSFKENRVISAGAYGDICKAVCDLPNRGKTRVAVKRLRFYLKEDIKSLFEKEIYVWAKLKHENILPLLGFAFDSNTGYPLLVSEWMKNGNAWTFVLSHPQCDLMRLILGTARGIAYLHDKGIVHSDIKSDNILVTDSEDALICDFGCSRMVASSRTLANVTAGLKGTAQYLAYELLASSESKHTQKTDVWAFGMAVYELLARQRPYSRMSDVQIIAAILKLELPRLSDDISAVTSQEIRGTLWEVCLSCWKSDPEERSDMKSILQRLSANSSDEEPVNTSDLLQDGKDEAINASSAEPSTLPDHLEPLLDVGLDEINVEVLTTASRIVGKEESEVVMNVEVRAEGREPWQVRKLYTDLLELEKQLNPHIAVRELEELENLRLSVELLDAHTPRKVGQRNARLQAYLRSLLKLSIRDKSEVSTFLTSNIVPKHPSEAVTNDIEGYLTKRENYRSFRTCYFILQGPVLDYFESPGGARLGSIRMSGAQVNALEGSGNNNDEYALWHAILVVEPARGPKERTKQHVLCAQNAKDRNAWREALLTCAQDESSPRRERT